MSDRSIEAQGPDVEAAVEAGLEKLGLDRGDVIIEVVDEGRKGLLGLGSKEAVVRLTPLPRPGTSAAPRATVSAPAAVVDDEATDELDEVESEDLAAPAEVDEEAVAVAKGIVSELVAKMGFSVDLTVDYSEPDEKTGRVMTIIQIEGDDDLGSLIGPHGETLNDLQYIARLMAGHALRRRADFLIDVDGYRERRKKALTSLANRMADKAVKRDRAVTLEPMSAYDRRIIHMALRDHDEVYTNSVGEGAERRVRIYLRQI
jgi:spoIIIJ-associated protein